MKYPRGTKLVIKNINTLKKFRGCGLHHLRPRHPCAPAPLLSNYLLTNSDRLRQNSRCATFNNSAHCKTESTFFSLFENSSQRIDLLTQPANKYSVDMY